MPVILRRLPVDFFNPMVFCQIYLRQFVETAHFATRRRELQQPPRGAAWSAGGTPDD
jgi:hypothetical protein